MNNFDVPQLKKISSFSRPKLNILVSILLITTLAGFFIAGYYFYKYQIEGTKNDPLHHAPVNVQSQSKDDVKKVVERVGKLMILPSGEDPTLAAIADITKLQDQPFFKNGKNGEQVLIYTQAKKVILYDPVANQVVNVADLNINDPKAQNPAKIVLRNGTQVSGLASKVEANIKKNFPDANIVGKDNANRANYDKTLVVPLNDGAKTAALNLAKPFNASTSSLPSGEAAPEGADLLVIIGKDQQ